MQYIKLKGTVFSGWEVYRRKTKFCTLELSVSFCIDFNLQYSAGIFSDCHPDSSQETTHSLISTTDRDLLFGQHTYEPQKARTGAQPIKLLLHNCSKLFFVSVQWNMWLVAASWESDCTSNVLQQKMPLLMQDLPADTTPVALFSMSRNKISSSKGCLRE